MQTEVAAELGIMPTMLRRWQRKLQEGSARPVRTVHERHWVTSSMRTMQAVAEGRNNNFDAIRFFAASAVILEHAYSLAGAASPQVNKSETSATVQG